MHGSFNKPGMPDNDVYRSVGFLVLPVLIVIALIGLIATHPEGSNWISEAVQAEFVGTDPVPDVAPTQIAKPAMEIRTVTVN